MLWFKSNNLIIKQVIKLNKEFAAGHNNAGIAKVKMGYYEPSLEDFTIAIGLNPEYGDAYLNRGLAREFLGDFEGSCNDWTKAFELGIEEAGKYISDCNGGMETDGKVEPEVDTGEEKIEEVEETENLENTNEEETEGK